MSLPMPIHPSTQTVSRTENAYPSDVARWPFAGKLVRMARGENEWVAWLTQRFRYDATRVPIGIGDDAAALRLDDSLVVVTADMLLDGVHFDTTQHDYARIGRKAIACSLSDCAAMACQPKGTTVSIALSYRTPLEQVQQLYEGMANMADEFDCPIIGGDTTAWAGKLAIDVTMLAEPMSTRGPIRRSGAKPGDWIYVTGPLGGSILGKHLDFTPQLKTARLLADNFALHAMMDISDGLSLDLHRLCTASGCDAELRSELLEFAISEAAKKLARPDGPTAREHALNDGEDFELLLVGESRLATADPSLLCLGRIVPRAHENPTITLIENDGRCHLIPPAGYQHSIA